MKKFRNISNCMSNKILSRTALLNNGSNSKMTMKKKKLKQNYQKHNQNENALKVNLDMVQKQEIVYLRVRIQASKIKAMIQV